MSMFRRPIKPTSTGQTSKQRRQKSCQRRDRMVEETDTEDLVEHFSSKYKLTPMSIDEARQQEAKYKKRMQTVPAHRRDARATAKFGDTPQFEFESIGSQFPSFTNGDVRHFAGLGTSTMSISWSIDQCEVTPDGITVEFDIKGYGFDYKEADQANRGCLGA